jgi:hypothetical protein
MNRFRHHTHFPKAKTEQAFRFPFVCFGCRKSFKLPASKTARVCPQCRQPMEMLSRKFSAPRSADLMQWRKVQYLVEHGFRFYSVYEPLATGGMQRVRYPASLSEAKEFVTLHRDQAWPRRAEDI